METAMMMNSIIKQFFMMMIFPKQGNGNETLQSVLCL
jgi:hypothetical protein